jgi:hypothetical protein
VELELETIRSNIRARHTDNNMNGNLSTLSHDGLPMKYSFKSIITNVKSVLKNARLVRPVLITCGLMIFQRFTGNLTFTLIRIGSLTESLFAGANSFGFYAVKIFRQTFFGMNPHFGAIGEYCCDMRSTAKCFLFSSSCCVCSTSRFDAKRTSNRHNRSNSTFNCIECFHVFGAGEFR